jgi:hypothetical protein
VPSPETGLCRASDARVEVGGTQIGSGKIGPRIRFLEAFRHGRAPPIKLTAALRRNQRPRRVRHSKIRLTGDELAPACSTGAI